MNNIYRIIEKDAIFGTEKVVKICRKHEKAIKLLRKITKNRFMLIHVNGNDTIYQPFPYCGENMIYIIRIN